MRIIFMGTPKIALPSLERISRSSHTIEAVFTQPGRASGRGRAITQPPVRTWASERGMRVFQPESLKAEGLERIFHEIAPDCCVAVAYGLILPKKILDIPNRGCINLHFSLLPKFRGAAPVNWALVRGETITGVTTFLMNEKMDEGDILLQEKIGILEGERADSLLQRMSEIGSHLLIKTLDLLERRELKAISQDRTQATYAPIIKKEDGRIDWKANAFAISCMVRGFYPWPGAYSVLNGKSVRLAEACEHPVEVPEAVSLECGTVVSCESGTIKVLCGQKTVLSIKMLQPEGRKEMTAQAAVNGRYVKAGDRFGS